MRIAALGDSYLTGYMVGGNSFIQLLQERYPIDNFGQNGATTEMLISQMKRFSRSYDLLIIHVGINDFLSGISVEQVEIHLVNLIGYLKQHSKKILFLVPPKINNDSIDYGWSNSLMFQSVINKQQKYGEFLHSLQNSDIKVISLDEIFSKNNLASFIDGIHPTKKMHQQIAMVLDEILREVEVEIESNKGLFST